jgi:hypothetical protein
LKFPLLGAFEPPHENKKILGPLQRISNDMQRFRDSDPVDYCVVGVGSSGGVLLQRLSKAGFKVVGLEAGPFWDTERDWVSDEKGSHKLYWNDVRITGGKDSLSLGENNSGKGVGVVPFIGLHLPRASIRRTFGCTQKTELAQIGPSRTRT